VARYDGHGTDSAGARRLFRPERWLGIELRHLAALEAVAEEASFNRAATRLGYTQSAISQQIAGLERAVGQRLIERPGGPSRVALTPAGRLLLVHAQTIGARLAAAYADLAAMERGALGSIRVGSFHTLGGKLVSQILASFDRLWPDVTVDLVEVAGDRELLVLLGQGELDVAFAHLPLPAGPFDSTPLLADEFVLVVPRGAGRLARGSIEELAKLTLIGLRSCRGCDPLLAHARACGLELQFAHQADSVRTIEGMIVAGLGSAVLPHLATELMSNEVEILDLGALDLPRRPLAAVWNADRITAAPTAGFVDAARAVSSRRRRRPSRLRAAEAAA